MTGLNMMCIPNIVVPVEFFFFQESPWSLKERQSGFTAGATRLDCPSL